MAPSHNRPKHATGQHHAATGVGVSAAMHVQASPKGQQCAGQPGRQKMQGRAHAPVLHGASQPRASHAAQAEQAMEATHQWAVGLALDLAGGHVDGHVKQAGGDAKGEHQGQQGCVMSACQEQRDGQRCGQARGAGHRARAQPAHDAARLCQACDRANARCQHGQGQGLFTQAVVSFHHGHLHPPGREQGACSEELAADGPGGMPCIS
jgi:hypothetical protein